MLQKKAKQAEAAEDREPADNDRDDDSGGRWTLPDFGGGRDEQPSGQRSRQRRDDGYRAPRSSGRQTVAEAAIKSVVRSVGSQVGRAIVRGILGSLTRRR